MLLDLHIRRATKPDISILAAILDCSWLASCPNFLPGECVRRWVEDGRARRQAEAIQPRSLLAENGAGEPLGFISVRGGLLEMLWVVPQAWGRGIGSALLGLAEDVIRGRGHRRGQLMTYRDNTRALAFYQAKGWRPIKEFVEIAPGAVLLPVLRLEKDLYGVEAAAPGAVSSPSTSLSAASKQSATVPPSARAPRVR